MTEQVTIHSELAPIHRQKNARLPRIAKGLPAFSVVENGQMVVIAVPNEELAEDTESEGPPTADCQFGRKIATLPARRL